MNLTRQQINRINETFDNPKFNGFYLNTLLDGIDLKSLTDENGNCFVLGFIKGYIAAINDIGYNVGMTASGQYFVDL